MKFEDMTTEDLSKLKLTPLKSRWDIRKLIGAGEVYVYRPYNGRVQFSKEKLSGANCKTIKVDNFEDITEEQFINVLGLTETTAAKYIWLQKYLKGEVDGTYNKEEDENLIKMLVKNAVADKEEKISELKEKIMIMSDEITELKDKNKSLKSEIKKYEKVKKAIKEIQEINL